MKLPVEELRFPQPGRTAREDTAAVMKFYKLPKCFPKPVLDEAKRVGEWLPASEKGKRLDLRKKFIFTCDPVTARDYDDALSLETDRRGNRVLGVHIADVSHYVKPGSAIDREAYRRSTSVYLCDRVVPMLPEVLCNGVCSLVPNEDRLAFSVFMTFDKNGEMVKRSFAKSVIRSKARFTYEQVMTVISAGEKRNPFRFNMEKDHPPRHEFHRLGALSVRRRVCDRDSATPLAAQRHCLLPDSFVCGGIRDGTCLAVADDGRFVTGLVSKAASKSDWAADSRTARRTVSARDVRHFAKGSTSRGKVRAMAGNTPSAAGRGRSVYGPVPG